MSRQLRIALEGLDGAGKSTIVAALAEQAQHSWPTRVVKLAPKMLALMRQFGAETLGNPDLYENRFEAGFRNRLYLTEAAIEAHYDRAEPQDGLVICDRWADTLAAYSDTQVDYPAAAIFERSVPKPDITFYIDVPAHEAVARLARADDWQFRRLGSDATLAMMHRLKTRYDAMYAQRPDVVVLRNPQGASSEVARQIHRIVAAKLPAMPAGPSVAAAAPCRRLGIEGIDGAGKTTLANRLASRIGGETSVERFAHASREILNASAPEGVDRAVHIRNAFPASFRQQSYLIDGMIRLTRATGRPRVEIFDRWFPYYNRHGSDISDHADFFAFLVARMPKPDLMVHIHIDPQEAARRLASRGDWMLRHHGAAQTVSLLESMKSNVEPAMREVPLIEVSGSDPTDAAVDSILSSMERHGLLSALPTEEGPAAWT